MNINRTRRRAGALAITALIGGSLATGISTGALAGASPAGDRGADSHTLDPGEGAAFAMTNSSAGNRIVSYKRSVNGTLTRVRSVATRGVGIGVDLDTQGPLRLSQNHRFLYAVNAGSDNVSVFAVRGTRLQFVQKVYAGDEPTSLAVHGHVVYVLDGSVASNSIRGFRAGTNGKLTPIENSIQPLSSPIAVPGDIEFSPDGKVLLVTEKTTARTLSPRIALDAFTVSDGVASPAKRDRSFGVRPFSLAFRNNGQVLVAEPYDASAGRSAVSSYRLGNDASLTVKSGSVPNHQTDTCWILVTRDQRHAFTANFGSGTISSYDLADDGTIALNQGQAAFLGPQSQPVDLAQTADSHYLYLLLRGTGAVAQFSIGADAVLTPLGIAKGGLPVADGASGLVVY